MCKCHFMSFVHLFQHGMCAANDPALPPRVMNELEQLLIAKIKC